MTFIQTLGGIQNLSNGPDIGFQYQDNGQPWTSTSAAHDGVPEAYRAIGKIRFVDANDGRGIVEYWYNGGILFEHLVPRYPNQESAESYVTELENLKNQSLQALADTQDLYDEFASLGSGGLKPEDEWNPATNTPNLSALGLANTAADKGKYFRANAVGTNSITGTSRNYLVGDGVFWNGVKFVFVRAADLSAYRLQEVQKRLSVRNLADPAQFTLNSWIHPSSGDIVSDTNYGRTGLIDVETGAKIVFKGFNSGLGIRHLAKYGENQTFIASVGFDPLTFYIVEPGVKQIIANFYIADATKLLIEKADAPGAFVIFSKAELKDTIVYPESIQENSGKRMVSDTKITEWDGKLAQSSVVTEHVTGKNIFNPSNFVADSFVNTGSGALQSGGVATGWIRTGPVDCSELTNYTVSGLATKNSKAIRFEKSDGTFISFFLPTAGAGTSVTFQSPALCAKFYVNLQRADEVITLNAIQIEQGTVATAPEAYTGFNRVGSIGGAIIPVKKVNGKAGNASGEITFTKTDFGLGSVDNTPDANKPISTLQQAALDLKLNKSSVVSMLIWKSKNLADLSTLKTGFFIDGATGNEFASAGYAYLGFIKVTPGETYTGRGLTNVMRHCAYYDLSQQFVTGGPTANTTSVTIPAGVYWVRPTCYIADIANFQFELGNAATGFVPFEERWALRFIDTKGIHVVESLTVANSEKILKPGCSYDESMYSPSGKSWIAKLSAQTDWIIANYGVSGNRLIDELDRLRKDTAVFGIRPSTFRPTYIILANNGNEYFDQYGENLDLYLEQFRIALQTVGALDAKAVIGTDYHVNGNIFLESGLKQFADRNKLPYMGIGLNGSKVISNDAAKNYQGFWAGSHPGVRTNSFNWTEWLYYISQLPRPRKSIKIFRPRVSGLTLVQLNYDTIPQRFERFVEIGVGERALNTADGSEAYYDRLNEGTTVDPSDENHIITNYTSQINANEYATFISGTALAFTDHGLFEIVLDRIRPDLFMLQIKGDPGLSFYLKNNNDSSTYESAGRDKELVFQVSQAVYDSFAEAVGTKFTSPGVKSSTVQFAFSGKLKSYAMGKGWFLCFTADSDVFQADRVTATTIITKVTGGTNYVTLSQMSAYRYHYSYFSGMYKPKGGWQQLTNQVVYAAGVYTITIFSGDKFFEFDKAKLLVVKSGNFNVSSIEVNYSGGSQKPEVAKEIQQKPFGTELIANRGFDANWTTTGGWSANGNSLVSMPAGVRDYPVFLTNTSHVELGFDSNGFSQKISRTITIPGTATDRRGWQKVIVRVVARMFPKVYHPTLTGPYYTNTPVITKTSSDHGCLCVGMKAQGGSYRPGTVMRQAVDIGWSELIFETTMPIMQSNIVLDIWRDCEVSNQNPDWPLQVFDVSLQLV